MGRAQGVTVEQLQALEGFENSPLFTPGDKALLRYAAAMTDTPVVVSEPLFAELRRHYTEAQLVELTSAFAWENYRARFDHALGVEAEGFSEGAAERS